MFAHQVKHNSGNYVEIRLVLLNLVYILHIEYILLYAVSN